MKYYLGNWQWVTRDGMSYFAPPSGATGAIDLGTLPDMAVAGVPRKGCLCWTSGGTLPSEYEFLGDGDCREISRTGRISAAFARTVGGVPSGGKLHEMILDCLISAADSDGSAGPPPIVPGIDGWMDLWLPGHGRVKGERFEWGRTLHTAKLRRVLRKEFTRLFRDANDGKLKDSVHHRRVLDDWCKKYGVEEWREFVPEALQRDVPGRVARETTINDNFNRADQSGLGTASGGFTYSSLASSAIDIVSNAAKWGPSESVTDVKRADSDLSSSDHYSQAAITTAALTDLGAGCIARKDSTSTMTFYLADIANSVGLFTARLFKCVAGTFTSLGTLVEARSAGDVCRCECNGSSISNKINGTTKIGPITDTAITGGVRTGIRAGGFSSVGNTAIFDSFEAADLAASTIKYTQLERGTRGVTRGVYTRSDG